ncbi:MAG: hypothetical protein DWH78_11565 [Planctomycetota bacterium]|nr:MAG: hypothetical protein DWH78_11565 [Planctomycetota bacterium]
MERNSDADTEIQTQRNRGISTSIFKTPKIRHQERPGIAFSTISVSDSAVKRRFVQTPSRGKLLKGQIQPDRCKRKNLSLCYLRAM